MNLHRHFTQKEKKVIPFRSYFLFAILLFETIYFAACIKLKRYPPEPVIEFVNYISGDTATKLGPAFNGKLTISFRDGDGDIGLNDSDTLPPFDPSSKYYHNFFVTKISDIDTVEYNYRVPVITPEGQNKTLNGEIDVNILILQPLPSWVKYEVYIADRNLHESNHITTDNFDMK